MKLKNTIQSLIDFALGISFIVWLLIFFINTTPTPFEVTVITGMVILWNKS